MGKRRNLIVFIALQLAATYLRAQATETTEDVRLTLQTKSGQTVFHVGELITLQLSYSLAPGSPNTYVITNANYDHSGRLGVETFLVDPAMGWDDPLKLYFQSWGIIDGGLFSSGKLTSTPTVIYRDLNEWVRFNGPGQYRLRVTSSRVQRSDYSMGGPGLKVASNEIALAIIPATPEWQKATLESAISKVDKSVSTSYTPDPDRDEAVAVLRYLGTPAAAQEMAVRLNEQDIMFQFMLGLVSTPARQAALDSMQQLFYSPRFPVNSTFLQTLIFLSLPSEITSDRFQQQQRLQARLEQELLGTLSSKQSKARAMSAYTFVQVTGMSMQNLDPDQKRPLTALLVESFDSLPAEAQLELLESRWPMLDHEAMKPLLPKIAQRDTSHPHSLQVNAYQANELSAAALRRWWEIDPGAARPAILQEILRPDPRFGDELLGLLPDETLPEADQPLVDHLTTRTGNEQHTASLIFRYATASIESEVTGYLDENVGKLACAIQTPLLAYLLRIGSSSADSFLRRAMTAGGAGLSACNQSLLVDVARLHEDPILQEFAIASLNYSEPQVAGNAATYLGTYGTSAAEGPLWDRLVAWSGQWKGREAELRYIPGENMDGLYQASLGSNLITALGAAKGWLTDDTELKRLIQLSVTPEQRNQAERLLVSWERQPRTIEFIPVGKGLFQIAQYQLDSLDGAVKKLSQFPNGAHFLWNGDLKEPGEQDAFDQISNGVKSRGITISARSSQ